MESHTTHSTQETTFLGEHFAQSCDHTHRLYLLTGDLGGGKTTFLQGVARGLGISQTITSPTFVVMKVYPTTRGPFKRLCHVDAYRLEPPVDLASLGIRDYLDDPETLICIEWGEKIAAWLPTAATISFTLTDTRTRVITLPEMR